MSSNLSNNDIVTITAVNEGLSEDMAEMLVKQANHESAQFTSNVYKTDHNAYGMKVPSIRKSAYIKGPSTIVRASEGTTPYAHYDSLEDSVKDMIAWLRYNGADFSKISNEEDYAAFLKAKGYYGDSQDNYTAALLRYYYDAKDAIGKAVNQHQGAVVATGVTLALMLVYFIARAARVKKK